MEAVEELTQLSESMRQVASLLADDDPCDDSTPRRLSTFVNAVALGNVGAGKMAVLNSLIGHPMLKEAARKNEEETEKLRQQGSEIQSFVRSLIGSKFASSDAQQ
ncbi:Os03g0732200 [Oryza sativa Japonica Group]|uniref:Os03g0732200 protein n=2 Tax=Oryza sativa subsp. japonica TaxID=39947 RepID=A0A979HKT1_ORYSJ|nr:Dynamin-2B, putative [Oryza sativa Japonica Group]EAZ28478.1 hypothetical protein OsJ_12460 [Oryza sativa Japonica Group]BAF13083.1 Os03g0732200 [Oryza sativa Japonica Group]|eukprot:NP_001051169.1 Os03g0732200 [Oryza sativa Japonica Group]